MCPTAAVTATCGSPGLTVRAFCQQERLSEASFYAWRRTILDRNAEAEAICRRAIELQPALVSGYANLGIALDEMGRFDEAQAAYEAGLARYVNGSWLEFAHDPQHTAESTIGAQDLQAIRWSTPVDLNQTGGAIHYGSPLMTPSNTVIVPVKTGATNGFKVEGLDGEEAARRLEGASS